MRTCAAGASTGRLCKPAEHSARGRRRTSTSTRRRAYRASSASSHGQRTRGGLPAFHTCETSRIIIFTGFVPISLLVSMEMVKFLQGQFMGWDRQMAFFVKETQEWQFCRAQTSGLNEELGQVGRVPDGL